MARLRAFSLITLWGSSHAVGVPEWGLYFELITGIYTVIQGSVISSKQLDAQTGYDTACRAKENCCLLKAECGKCHKIAFFISHLMLDFKTRKPMHDYRRCDTIIQTKCHYLKVWLVYSCVFASNNTVWLQRISLCSILVIKEAGNSLGLHRSSGLCSQ